MPDLRSLWKMAQYVPMAYELLKAVMPSKPAETHDETREELEHFQRTMANRFSDMEEEIARLRARVREAESLASSLQLWLWLGLGALFLLFIVLLILVIPHA